MNAPPLVSLRGFGVAFGPQVVLSAVDLDLPRAGVTVLVGPVASGKSTLLRTLAGLNDAHPSLRTWGHAEIMGEPLPAAGRPPGVRDRRIGYVMQHARFFMDTVRENLLSALPDRSRLGGRARTEVVREILAANGLDELRDRLDHEVVSLPTTLQRRLAIVRAGAADPAVLLVDEVTASLPDREALAVTAMLQEQARRRSVLVVTHNQAHARAVGGNTALLAEGRIQETAPTEEFFASPRSEIARHFVRTGGYSPPPPSPGDAATPEEVPRPAPAQIPSRFVGPRGFFWALPGKLGGLPRPGIVADIAADLEGLARLGVDVLVTLEETRTIDPAVLRSFDVSSLHFPIPDQGVPPLEAAIGLCREVDELLARGRAVAFHCRAGLGRTGTMLACQLVRRGIGAAAAVERVRQLNHRCIQTDGQARFVKQFEEALIGGDDGGPPRGTRGEG